MLRTRARWRRNGSENAMMFSALAVSGVSSSHSAWPCTAGTMTRSGTASNGSSTQKQLPRCSLLSKPMVPPIASVSAAAAMALDTPTSAMQPPIAAEIVAPFLNNVPTSPATSRKS